MDECVKQYLNQRVQVARPSRRRGGGDEQLEEPVELNAYFESFQRREPTATGFEFTTRHRVITEEQIDRSKRIWLIGIDALDKPGRKVLETEGIPDFTTGEIDHYETVV